MDCFDENRRIIFDWLYKNLRTRSGERVTRKHKMSQLWICGPANIGKTFLVRWLMQFFDCFMAPMVENHWENYISGKYDLVVFDEFNGGHIKANWLNRFLEGGPAYPLVGRHVSPMKSDNPPVIICCNVHPDVAYANANSAVVDALKARLKIVEFDAVSCGALKIVPASAPHTDDLI